MVQDRKYIRNVDVNLGSFATALQQQHAAKCS